MCLQKENYCEFTKQTYPYAYHYDTFYVVLLPC